MTLIIEVFVYPDAWPTHGTWAACFLMLMTRGPGLVSLDHLIARRASYTA
jgi:putative oxidoreductase